MSRALRALGDALGYFTILPVPGAPSRSARPDGYALAFLPLIGGAIGGLAGAFGAFTAWRMPGFGGVAALLALVVLSGAVHVDGFLDCCDALFASAPPQRRLEILRDPHHGTFAIVGAVLAGLIWLRALDVLTAPSLPLALAFTGIVSRAAALANAWVFPYARRDGFAASFKTRPALWPVALAIAVACAVGWMAGPATLILIPLAIGAGILLGWFSARRLGGGITGDVYGAVVAVVEIALLLRFPELQRILPR